MQPLLLLSYNIQFGKNLNNILLWILQVESRPDIICFQEFPQSEITQAKEKMKGYGIEFLQSFSKDTAVFGELTLYNKKRLKLLRHTKVDLGKSRLDKRAFKIVGNRSALITFFTYGRKQLAIANIHLTVLSSNRRKRRQLQLILNELPENVPAVIAGDYNYTNLLRKRGLVSYLGSFGYELANNRTVTHYMWKRIPQQIDYIFYKSCVISDVSVREVRHSDHLPIICSLTL